MTCVFRISQKNLSTLDHEMKCLLYLSESLVETTASKGFNSVFRECVVSKMLLCLATCCVVTIGSFLLF
jgi:hypothetical protein